MDPWNDPGSRALKISTHTWEWGVLGYSTLSGGSFADVTGNHVLSVFLDILGLTGLYLLCPVFLGGPHSRKRAEIHRSGAVYKRLRAQYVSGAGDLGGYLPGVP